MQYLEYTYAKKVFLGYLKFKFHWKFCILSGNPILEESHFDCTPAQCGSEISFYSLWVCLPSHFPMTTFQLPPTPQRCLESLLFPYLDLHFLASQWLPRLHLYLEGLHYQFLFFLSFPWVLWAFQSIRGSVLWKGAGDTSQQQSTGSRLFPKDISKSSINHCAGQTRQVCNICAAILHLLV